MARVVNFDSAGVFWVFKIEGRGDDFFEAIDALKAAVPPFDRRYDPEEHEWMVTKGLYDEALASVFTNWRGKMQEVRDQIPMILRDA
jgi:hypothetical protein